MNLSNCCKAPIKATHGCDDDLLHGGKKCSCEIVTSWYVCEKCKQACDLFVDPDMLNTCKEHVKTVHVQPEEICPCCQKEFTLGHLGHLVACEDAGTPHECEGCDCPKPEPKHSEGRCACGGWHITCGQIAEGNGAWRKWIAGTYSKNAITPNYLKPLATEVQITTASSEPKPSWLDEHTCRFNDGEQSCECFAEGFEKGFDFEAKNWPREETPHISSIQKALNNYEDACENLAARFMEKYYVEDTEYPFHDWVGGTVGEVMLINDDYWSLSDMVTALDLSALPSKLFKWHNESMEAYQEKGAGNGFPNLKNYLLYFIE